MGRGIQRVTMKVSSGCCISIASLTLPRSRIRREASQGSTSQLESVRRPRLPQRMGIPTRNGNPYPVRETTTMYVPRLLHSIESDAERSRPRRRREGKVRILA
jgi:hypothetical protein